MELLGIKNIDLKIKDSMNELKRNLDIHEETIHELENIPEEITQDVAYIKRIGKFEREIKKHGEQNEKR